MQDLDKSKEELATEVAHLRQRIAELEKSEVVLEEEAILNTLVEHMIHQDREMKILWANEAACDSAGLSREELIGFHCYEIWPKRSDPCPDCPVMKAMETGRLQEVEKMTSDGRAWFIRGYPLRNKKGNIVGGIEFTLDITERKQAEKALRESEERFRALFEGAPDAIFLADPVSGEILDANPAASHLLLKPHEEIVGLHQSQIHPPHIKKNAREGFTEHLQQILRKKQIRPIESVVMRSDGSEVTVEVLAQIVHTQGKKIIQGTFRDITERKQAEDDLRRSEERYRELADNITDVFFAMDKDLQYTYWNKASENLMGIPAKDALGKSLYEIFPEVKGTTAEAVYREALKTQHPQIVEQPYQVGDKNIDFEISVYPLRDGLSVFAKDITERKQVYGALKDSRTMLQTVLDSIPSAVFWKDRDSIYLGGNRAWLEAAGLKSSEDVVGKSDYDLPWEKEQADAFQENDMRVMESGVAEYNIMEPYIRADGTHAWAKTNKVPLRDSEGNIIGVLGTYEDITELKQAEEKMRESEERYRFLFENSQTINILIGIDGKILDVNESAAQSLGYKKKSIIGKEVIEFVIPEQRIEVAQQLALELKEEYTPPLEIDIITKKGTRTLLFTKGHATLFEKAELKGILLSAVDITERKKSEKELKIKDNAIASSNNAIAIGEFGGNLTYVNSMFLKMWGYDDEKEILGKPAINFWYTKEKAQEIMEALLKGEPVIGELQAKRKDGSLFDVQLSASLVADDTGKPISMMAAFVDITERKQAEEKLRESEERFRTICETAQDFIALKDRDCKFTYVNPAMERIFGIPSSKLIGKTSAAIFGKEKSAHIIEEDLRVLKGEIVDEEHPSPVEENSTIHHIIKVPIRNSAGEIIGLCNIGRDITERKQIEEALRESEERYRTLVDNIDLGINLIDADHTILMANASVDKKWDMSKSDIIGKKCFQVFEHRGTVCPDCPGVQAMATGQPAEVEHEEVRDDHGSFHVRIQTFPVFGQGGSLTGFIEIAEDITDRKQAENALRESEGKYRSLVESSEDSIYLVDRNCNYIFLNDKHLSRLGMKRNQLVGRAYDEFHAPEESQDFAQRVKRVLKTGTSQTYEYQSQRDNRYFIRTLSPVISPDGGVIKAITVISKDITERKQAEEKLRDREAFNYALFQYNPVETIVVDLEGRVTGFNLAKKNSDDRLPTNGDLMYKDYAGKHEIDMCAELMKCIRSGRIKEFPERKYGDKYLNITVSPFAQGAIIISEDITERKRAEEALRESEQFSSSLLRNAPNPIMVVNSDTSIRYVNPALEKLTGFSAPELIGRKHPYPWWMEEIIPETTKGLKRTIHQGAQKIQKHFQKKSGEPFWVEITAEPVMHDRKVRYLLTNWIDITERKQAEKLLQKERDTFYSILDKSPYGVMVQDIVGNHSFVNTEFTNITGYTLKDIPTTQEWLHLAYPDEQYRNMVSETWENDYTESKADETFRERFGRVFSRTFNVLCKDGAAKDIEFRTSVIGDEGIIFMLSDITDRKRIHTLLETAAAEWRTTFDAISDAVCLLDPYGKIIRCNNAMLKLVGKPFSQITNHHCWELLHGVSEAPLNCPISHIAKSRHRETEVIPKDSRWFNVSVDPLFDENGKLIGGVHIMSDITDRKRIDDELQTSREQLRNLTVYLESVREQERTNIAREIHDELAQALTALKMDVSWLDHRLPSDAESLIAKTKSMSTLIDGTIHIVKRISAELRPGILDDLGLVAAIEWQAEEFQKRTDISCSVTVEPEDITVDQDRATAIFRIFQETLTNVARHARATRVAVSLKERAGKLTLRVKDNGIGISEEQISDPQSFGLIGMQERIIPWDGTISFKSIPDKGTTVIVRVGLGHSKMNIERN